MAFFLVTLSVEVEGDTHEEAARRCQGALPEYASVGPMTYEVKGYAANDAVEQTTHFIELPGLPESNT